MRDLRDMREINNFFNEEFFKPLEPLMNDIRKHPFPLVFNMDMRTDVVDNGDSFIFEIEVPGVKKEDISLELESGMLIISIEKKSLENESTKNYISRERHYGKLVRKFNVEGISNENISAKYENGVLFVTIKKPEEKKANKIEIQ